MTNGCNLLGSKLERHSFRALKKIVGKGQPSHSATPFEGRPIFPHPEISDKAVKASHSFSTISAKSTINHDPGSIQKTFRRMFNKFLSNLSVRFSRAPLWGRLLSLPTNIRLRRKGFPGPNTPAYYEHS